MDIFSPRYYCHQVPVDVFKGITDADAAKVVDGLAPKVADRNESIEQVKQLYKLFVECDCTLLEVQKREDPFSALTHRNYVSSIDYLDRHSLILIPVSQVNPMAETADNQLVAADAKLNFDDNAAFRQKEIFALRDSTQEDPREVCIPPPPPEQTL